MMVRDFWWRVAREEDKDTREKKNYIRGGGERKEKSVHNDI